MKTKYLYIAFIVAALLYAAYMTLKKFKPDFFMKDALKQAIEIYPSEIVKNAERIFRLETNHFKSAQYKQTFSPGMEKFANKYPYGWQSLHVAVWAGFPQYAPIGFLPFTENRTGLTKWFLKFRTPKAALFTLCEFLKLHNNNAGRWFSLNSESQNKYNISIAKIKPAFTNDLIT